MKARTPKVLKQPIEAASNPNALLKVETVAALIGTSKQWVYRRLAVKQFPEPVRLGQRCTRWRASEVRAWLEAQ